MGFAAVVVQAIGSWKKTLVCLAKWHLVMCFWSKHRHEISVISGCFVCIKGSTPKLACQYELRGYTFKLLLLERIRNIFWTDSKQVRTRMTNKYLNVWQGLVKNPASIGNICINFHVNLYAWSRCAVSCDNIVILLLWTAGSVNLNTGPNLHVVTL